MRVPRGSANRGCVLSVRWMVVGAFGVVALVAGCAGHPLETGYADQGKLQIQFFAPPGTSVAIKDCPTRSHEINTYPPDGERLERSPEEYCVFNLSPGRYEFKYTAAEGLPGVSVYGELEVRSSCREYAKVFQRRSFIPISLPSSYYKTVDTTGDEIFPFRNERVRAAIDEKDLIRLRQGDVIEKAFIVADLKNAERCMTATRRELAVLDRKLEYAEVRFKSAYAEFRLAADDPVARFWGQDREFIKWEKERLDLQDKIEKAQAKLKRTETLLRGDRVLIRRGMLVIATEELVKPHDDLYDAADDLGAVLLVMRVGGRHMHWGEPARELASFAK